LLGLAAGLFWMPLVRVAAVTQHRLTGAELLGALPSVTVAAGVLLTVVHCVALSLPAPRPALLGSGLFVTVAALHTAPLFLGIRPEPASADLHGALARSLSSAAGLDSPAAVLRGLPLVLQLMCLALAAVLLRTLGVHWRVTGAVVWVLAVTGWAAQNAFAAAGLPVFLGLLAVTTAAFGIRRYGRRRRRRRPRSA
ncbi:MAG TPA: lipopolysaccharide biosynthesis protein, partial [Streptomyces sp.]